MVFYINCTDTQAALISEMYRYVDHLRTAHGETRHVCKFCAKLFKLKGSLLVSHFQCWSHFDFRSFWMMLMDYISQMCFSICFWGLVSGCFAESRAMLDEGWICELYSWLFLHTPDLSNLNNSCGFSPYESCICVFLKVVFLTSPFCLDLRALLMAISAHGGFVQPSTQFLWTRSGLDIVLLL